MLHRFILFLVCLLVLIACSQKHTVYNSWSNISLEESVGVEQDSVFYVVSNRVYNPEDTNFLNDQSNHGELHYFQVCFADSIFRVQELPEAKSIFEKLNVNDPLVVYTEGMGKTFPIGVERCQLMKRQYPVQVIYFDYPSIHSQLPITKNFYYAYHEAQDAGVDYHLFFSDIKDWVKRVGHSNVNLFFHSMGNNIVKTLPEIIAEDTVEWVNNLVLNAPCLPDKSHKAWLEKVSCADHVFLNYNRRDYQLNGAHIITFDKMLGENPRAPYADNTVYIDFHPLVNKTHSNFLDIGGRDKIHPRAYEYYHALFTGEPIDLSDTTKYQHKSIFNHYILR